MPADGEITAEHRPQITTLMGQQGIEPPPLSGWRYFDEEIAPQRQ